ncbi:MAG: hypothetical protein AAGN66_27545 [Acidobacteriota bacterium]
MEVEFQAVAPVQATRLVRCSSRWVGRWLLEPFEASGAFLDEVALARGGRG